MKNYTLTICDDDGMVLFESSIQEIQKEWDNNPMFADEGVEATPAMLAEIAMDYLNEVERENH